MPLNKSQGNMYPFVTHTWNPIKGACPHECSYCYMNKIYKRFGNEPAPPHLVKSELKTDLGSGNYIFVGSSIDMFFADINPLWLGAVLYKTFQHDKNNYLWHTKNPECFIKYFPLLPNNHILCTTIETDYCYTAQRNSPSAMGRIRALDTYKGRKMVTIEPIMDFSEDFARYISYTNPEQVNIGADTGNNHLPEPPKEEILELISELERFTKVYQKENLGRLLK
jgi:DNA repair photolyase